MTICAGLAVAMLCRNDGGINVGKVEQQPLQDGGTLHSGLLLTGAEPLTCGSSWCLLTRNLYGVNRFSLKFTLNEGSRGR